MVRISFTSAAVLALITSVLASPQGIVPDANGAKNVGKGNKSQFITGECINSLDCASGCCAGIVGNPNQGICSGPAVGNVNGKNGCGFGDGGAGSQNNAGNQNNAGAGNGQNAGAGNAGAVAGGACNINQNAAGVANVGKGNAAQFITGQCASAADCASGCCGAGQCRARAVVEAEGGNCNFSCTL